MAQLSNDCFAADDRLLPLPEALALIAERVSCVVGTETVPLAAADNRILADAIVAPIDLPPFANSAVDGYAVDFADLAAGAETVLPVRARLAAGAGPGAPGRGGAVRIFTGAPMPPGFDTVFMQEDVSLDAAGRVRLPPGLDRGANHRPAGEDLRANAAALPAGRRLGPPEIALLGALGLDAILVRRPLRVALLSTGDEVARPGAPLAAGHLYDANRPMLAAWLRRLGCTVGDLGILADRREVVTDALGRAAADHDLIVTSGGVSMGEEDHVRAALAALGPLAFWRLGIKPGRPVALGMVDGTPSIGLPGNPVAVFVTFAAIARPLLARLAGEAYLPPIPVLVRSGFAYRKKAGRREYVRVGLARSGTAVTATKHPRDGAGVITSLTETNGLAVLPEDMTRLAIGEDVEFLSYASLI